MRYLSMLSVAWRYFWPAPYTVFGLLFFLVPIRGSRSVVFHRGTIGVIGPAIDRLLGRIPVIGGAIAITFGHTILARDLDTFYSTWNHERVHVNQYQRWGWLFVPMYLAAGLWMKLRKKDPYWDNPFEIEARRIGDGIDC
jgi:hypothetical protein